jgi:glycosyltransferase involved in cell wall biosynthesis
LLADFIAADESDVRHSICHFGDDATFEAELRGLGAAVTSVGAPTYRALPRTCKNLFDHLRERNVEVLHTHLIHATGIGRPVGAAAGVDGILSTIHNHRRSFTVGQRAVERATRRLDDTTVAVSAEVRRSFDGAATWATVPNGIRIERFNHRVMTADRRAVPELNDDSGPIYLNVGRLVPLKNQRMLIEAMPAVAAKKPEAKLLIVGEGPLRADLETHIRNYGLETRVTLAGQVDEIAPYFAAADCFVFPSTVEGLPIAPIEAMAASLPVVASDAPGVRNLVDDGTTGRLVPPDDPTSLAAAMLDFTAPAERNHAGQAAYRRARTEFDISTTVGEYTEIYERIATE